VNGRLPNEYTFTINISGVGNVETDIGDCYFGTCTNKAYEGEPIRLVAYGGNISWGGACASCGTSSTCDIEINSNTNCSVSFSTPGSGGGGGGGGGCSMGTSHPINLLGWVMVFGVILWRRYRKR